MTVDNRKQVCWSVVAMMCLVSAAGCRERTVDTAPPTVVLVDVATNRPVVAQAVDAYPAFDPATGKATLMPAMYCAGCGIWRAVPTPNQINRVPHATQCPDCQGQLSLDGPIPPAVVDREYPTEFHQPVGPRGS